MNLNYNFFKVVIILYCLYTAKNILMVFFFYLEIFPPKFIFIWKFKKLNKKIFNVAQLPKHFIFPHLDDTK